MINFPGQSPTRVSMHKATVYLVETNAPNNARVECDYVQFMPERVLFWQDAEPNDRLVLALPLRQGATVRMVSAEGAGHG